MEDKTNVLHILCAFIISNKCSQTHSCMDFILTTCYNDMITICIDVSIIYLPPPPPPLWCFVLFFLWERKKEKAQNALVFIYFPNDLAPTALPNARTPIRGAMFLMLCLFLFVFVFFLFRFCFACVRVHRVPMHGHCSL